MGMGQNMATEATGLTNVHSKSRALIILVSSFGSTAVSAGELTGSLAAGVSYTDNVLLTASPGEIDDLVYWVSPTVNFLHESPQLDANLRYRFDWYQYDELNTTSSFHMGEASLTGRAWQESLELEIGAIRAQVLRDPGLGIPAGRLPISNNLVDLDQIYVNPRLQRDLGGSVSIAAQYRYSENSYDDPSIQRDTNHLGRFSLDNYRNGQGLTWALRYDWRRTEYEISIPWENQQVSAELGAWVNTNVRVFASGGKESPWDDPFNASLEDEFWEVGFAHTSGETLNAEFAVGERSFGSSWRGRLESEFRRGTTSLSYDETPMTTGFNMSGGRQDVFDPDDLDEFLDVPGRAERYLSKRLEWNLDMEFRRTGFTVALFDEDRSGRTTADGTRLVDQSQRGMTLIFTWRAAARTEFEARGAIIRRDSGVTLQSDFYVAGLVANYQLGARSELSLAYDYAEEQPREEVSAAEDYVSNVASLSFTYTF